MRKLIVALVMLTAPPLMALTPPWHNPVTTGIDVEYITVDFYDIVPFKRVILCRTFNDVHYLAWKVKMDPANPSEALSWKRINYKLAKKYFPLLSRVKKKFMDAPKKQKVQ
jgi:hypothetical protein